MIIKHLQPFSIVKDEGFLELPRDWNLNKNRSVETRLFTQF
jgi:hypothetical protein